MAQRRPGTSALTTLLELTGGLSIGLVDYILLAGNRFSMYFNIGFSLNSRWLVIRPIVLKASMEWKR
jgi:hypothetical protein